MSTCLRLFYAKRSIVGGVSQIFKNVFPRIFPDFDCSRLLLSEFFALPNIHIFTLPNFYIFYSAQLLNFFYTA